jgi:hypothetical protein
MLLRQKKRKVEPVEGLWMCWYGCADEPKNVCVFYASEQDSP